MDKSEKAVHEAFVTSKDGCNPLELLLIGGILMYSTVLHSTLVQLPAIETLRKNIWFSASLAIFVQCVPFILSFTLLADYWACLVFTVIALALGIRFAQRLFDQWTPTKEQGKKLTKNRSIAKVAPHDYPGLTSGRAQVILMTIFGILAVDFSTVPRYFAKTEKTGFSPMDLGVGAFVIIVAVSSREAKNRLPTERLQYVWKAARGSIALVILGMLRLLMVTVFNYQNPAHEYGVHWNFFFTLACTRILTSVVYATVPIHLDWVVAVIMAGMYEACLLSTPLALFLDNDDRSGFLAANKEGLASIVGYVALHLAAAATARTLGYKPRNNARDWIMTALQAAGVTAVAFAATYIMHTTVDPVSRRLANLSYCLWMYSLGTFAVALSVMVTFLRIALLPRNAHIDYNLFAVTNTDNMHTDVDILWKSINYNGMAVFLLANILTGLVNVFFHPRTATDGMCVVALVSYIYVVCMFAVILHHNKIKLKLPFT
ncbi:phosphatidylinositol-glycan biosynthesis class W protein-like isoform X1 [Dermacentor andersoni]|uniref:phosphatidylinositol-glycan biosynthesis class W protein-like isoform X1 n=2 Tax=Dermacentor andersoni TaxID=34620 RepID=UPI002155F384|nr:phosphatidylinositol-glycan biosynthesis class W protein-like isoform X1 [Dermacentor andersoni]